MERKTAIDLMRIDIKCAEMILAEQKAIRDNYEYGSICYGTYNANVARLEGKIAAWKEAIDLLA